MFYQLHAVAIIVVFGVVAHIILVLDEMISDSLFGLSEAGLSVKRKEKKTLTFAFSHAFSVRLISNLLTFHVGNPYKV